MTTRWTQSVDHPTIPCRHCENGFVVNNVNGNLRAEVCEECHGTRMKPTTVKECNG